MSDKQTLKLISEMNSANVHAVVNALPAGAGLAWRTLFPLKFTPNFSAKIVEGNEGYPVAANRVAFNSKAPEKTRKTLGSIDIELGKISVSRTKGEKEIQELNELSFRNSPTKQEAEYLVDQIYDDPIFVRSACDAQVEIMGGGIFNKGVSLANTTDDGSGNIIGDEVAFVSKAEQFSGAKTAWGTAATADGIADIVDRWRAAGKKPKFVSMTEGAFEKLIMQEATKKRLASNVAIVANATSFMTITLDNINAYMRANKYPQIQVFDSTVIIEAEDGTQTEVRPLKDHVVVLHELQNIGYTYYKPKAKSKNGATIQVENEYMLVTIKEDFNPDMVTTIGDAYVFVAPVKRASMRYINVNKTSWSNGADK